MQVIYENYLLTERWRLQCTRKIALDGGLRDIEKLWILEGRPYRNSILIRCEACGERFRRREINIHHKTYARLGHEKPEDLVIWCEPCHKEWHRKKKEEQAAIAAQPNNAAELYVSNF